MNRAFLISSLLSSKRVSLSGAFAFNATGNEVIVSGEGVFESPFLPSSFNCSNYTKLTLSEGITEMSINESSQDALPFITALSLPSTLSAVDEDIFDELTQVKHMIIGSNIIASLKSFYRKMEVVEFVDPVDSIPSEAFEGSVYLEEVIIKAPITVLEDEVFHECRHLRSLSLPSTLKEIKQLSIGKCSSLEYLIIPKSVTQIGKQCFLSCTSLKTIIMSEDLLSIGEQCFQNCNQIENIQIPSTVTTIGDGAFLQCSSMKHIDFPKSCKEISNNLFKGCSNLEFDIPKQINSIQSNSFLGCVKITHIIISENVHFISNVLIGDYITSITLNSTKILNNFQTIFREMSSQLIKVEINANEEIPEIPTKTFYNMTSLEEIIIPSTILRLLSSSFSHCSSLINIELPQELEHIGDNSFERCSSLTNITFPSKLKTIGQQSFYGCKCIERIILPSSIEKLGKESFSHCERLQVVGYYGYNDFGGEEIFSFTNITTVCVSEKYQNKTFCDLTITPSNDPKCSFIPYPTPKASPTKDQDFKLSKQTIIIISSVGGVVLIALIGVIIYLVLRKKPDQDMSEQMKDSLL